MAPSRRLDRFAVSPLQRRKRLQRSAEWSNRLNDQRPIVEIRSLHAALRALVETTGGSYRRQASADTG